MDRLEGIRRSPPVTFRHALMDSSRMAGKAFGDHLGRRGAAMMIRIESPGFILKPIVRP